MENATIMFHFNLTMYVNIGSYRYPAFVLCFLLFAFIVCANLVIILALLALSTLHEPMYIFLCNLCINGLYGTSGFYPKFLNDLLSTTHVISYAGCLLQGFVLHSSACADFSLLALMAYDRYVAICRPLVYHSMMSKQRVCVFVFFAWFLPLYLMFMSTVTTSTSRLCGSHIPKIYCVNYFIGKLACTVSITNNIIPPFNYIFYFGHFIFIIWSYVYLISTCLTSKENRTKFMQTCLPHFFCLVTLTVCILFDLLYMRLGSETLPQSAQNFMAIEFIFFPPIINPLIYGFKLTQIRNRIIQFWCGKRL
ncbi:olfactory receptor 142-like [Micropterus dolomieu]|uniref:olfactory receptor 142-like n=1 Tax=Micropterus dolomieu TaxID=147949 RepID=UPI001E8CAA6D|nr:olfactory receptor 142-like [Micropterus dolomieu]